MEVFQVIQGMSDPASGPTYCVTRLAQELIRTGDTVTVKTLGTGTGKYASDVTVDERSKFLERRLGVSLGLMRELAALGALPVVLHGHGLWRLLNLFPLLLRNPRARIVWSPQGALSDWSLRSKRLLKQPFWSLLQERALQRCHCYHATSLEEYEQIRRVGLAAPVAVIPNGIDDTQPEQRDSRQRTVLYVGRIDPVKGIDLLLDAWSRLEAEFADWQLTVVGPMRGPYARKLREKLRALGSRQVEFAGEVVGHEKWELYGRASVFVLPSRSENFGVVVAEALMHELPVITTTATPWKSLADRDCGWCVPVEETALEQALREAMCRRPEELHSMGLKGRQWMVEEFSWPGVVGRMRSVYSWLLGRGPKPACVILD